MTGQRTNIVPSKNDVINQRVFRQLTVGWVPFMGLFEAGARQAFSYKADGEPESAKFAWGPTMDSGGVWKFARQKDLGYMQDTVLPFIHWLYKGTKETWATQLLAMNGSNIGADYGVKFPSPQGAAGYLKGRNSLTLKGLMKPAKTGDTSKYLAKLLNKISSKGATQDKMKAMEELFSNDWTADDFIELASKDQLPELTDFGSKFEQKAKVMGGPPNATPRFLSEQSWRLSTSQMDMAAAWLSTNLIGDVLDLYRESDEEVPEREPKPYRAESGEEKSIAILMDRYSTQEGVMFAPDDFERQFIKDSTVGELPANIRGQRQNVDISTKGAEGAFVYELRNNDTTLQKVIKMSQDKSVGIEITADDLADKGGYISIDYSGDIESILKEIAAFNKQQIDEIQTALNKHGQDLDKAVTALETSSGADNPDRNPLGFQTRQTAVRLLDAASDGIDMTEGFEFTAPFSFSGENYLATWAFTINGKGGGPADLNGPYEINSTEPDFVKIGQDMQLFLDVVGVAMSGGFNQWQSQRDALFDDLIYQQLAVRGAEADGLMGQWTLGGLTPYTDNNVYPTANLGFKMPFEIAKDIQEQLKANIAENSRRGSFLDDLSDAVVKLTRDWKKTLNVGTWESNKSFIQGDNTFGTSTGGKNINAWMLPSIFLGGTAASYGIGDGKRDTSKAWSPLQNPA